LIQPLFFFNRDLPPDRIRLTLAHELGQYSYAQHSTPEAEEQAYAFAAEFLVPEDELKEHSIR